jgi:DNA-binding NarL/FixJ family response regulator
MKTRILFVDDEPNVLEGLRNRLHRQRKKWDMHFASSGADALALLATQPMDVIVTDMRMPGMDGAALLAAVKQAYPGMVRIVLSGHAELATALRAVPVAHQFLTKPCEAGVIEATVERACNLQAIITDPVVERVVGGSIICRRRRGSTLNSWPPWRKKTSRPPMSEPWCVRTSPWGRSSCRSPTRHFSACRGR